MQRPAALDSPLDGFIENVSIGSILGCECIAAILHAEHHKRLRAVVAHTAATVGSHTDNTAFFDRKYIAVDLKLSFAFEEEIEFLVIFVGV